MNSVDVLEPDTNVSVTAEVATTLPGNTGEAAIGSNVVKNSEDYLRVEDEILKVGMDSEEGRQMTEALVGYRYENGMVSKYRTNRYDDEGMNLYMDLSRDLSKDSEARSRVRERKGEQFLQWWDNAGMEDKNLVIADGIGRSLVGNPVRGRVLLAEKNGLANEEDDGEIADFVRQQTIALDAKRSQDSADSLRAYEDMVSSISKQAELPGVEGERSEAYVKALQKLNKSYELANQAFVALDGDGLLGVQGLRTAGGAYIRSPEWYGKLSKLRKQDKVAYDLLLSSLSRKVDELGADSVVFLGMMGNAVSQTMLGAAESVGSSNLVPVGMSPTATLESGWKPPTTRTPDVWWNEDFSAIKNDLNAVANRTFSSGREGWFSSGFDEVGGMAGHTFSFFMGGGVFSFMNSFSQSYAKYNSEGNGRDTSAGVAFGEALGEWAVERITFGKLGKLVGGKSFEAVSKGLAVKAGNFPVIGRILKSQNVVVRIGTNATIGYIGEHGEEVVTPYAQWMLGNMFGGGNGMDLSDANDQMFEVLSPRLGAQIFGFSAVMSLFGMGVNRMQRGRYERAISKEARARSLDIAESPEAMSALGLTENEILEIRNTTSPDKKIKLLDGYASERESEMPGDASGGERGYLVFAPEQDIVQELMQEKAIDTYVADGKGNYRVTNRQTGEVLILDKETAFAQLSKEVNLLNVREQYNLSRAVATNEYVDSFAKRDKSIAWESMSKADTIQTLQVLSNKATMRIAELTKAGVKNAGSVVDSSVHSTLPLRNVAVLGSSAKSRLELELNRSPDNGLSGKNAVFPALNVRLAATKKLIRFAKNEASVIDLIEEVAELYTKDQYAKGISPESIGQNLRLVQNELRGQKVRDWKLIAEDGEMTRQMVTEGMSKLVKAVAMATHNRGRMSEASRRFMAWAEALLEWVRDLVKAGAAFHNAAMAGKIDANFEKMVYEAVGVSLGDHLADQAETDLSTELENIDGGNMSVNASDYDHLSSLAQWRSSIIRDMKKDPDQQRVVDYIIKALTGKPNKDGQINTNSFIDYREVNSEEVKQLKNLTGRDFTDFEWRFVESDILHAYRAHKNDSKSKSSRKSGHRDISKSDIIIAPFFIDHLFSSKISNFSLSNWTTSSSSVEFNIITPFDERCLIFQIHEMKSKKRNFLTSKNKTPTISFKTSWAKYSLGISPTLGGSNVPSASSNLGTIASDVNSNDTNDFSINYDAELDSYLEASRASAVREYWRVVKDKTESEISELERLFARTDAKSDPVAILARARGVIRASINALPVESQGKIQSYKELLDLCLSMVSDGKIDARSKLSETDLAAINMKIDAHPELLSEWMDKTMAEMVLKVYKRCSQVINLQVRDDLIRDVSRMLREVEPEIDTDTRKYKVGKLGANNTRFLREVIRTAIFATEEDALSQIKGLEVDIAACFDDKGGLISGMEEQYHQLNREKMVWENYGAMGSSDVDRVMDTHKYVTDFLDSSSYAWQEHLAKRRAKWTAMKDKLSRNLPIEATPAELHRASDPENKVNNGRLISIGRSMESSIDFLDTMGKAIGMKDAVEELRKKFVHAMSLIGVESVTRQRRFNDFLEGLLGTRNQGKINSFLLDWRKQGAFRGKEKLRPFEYQEIKLPIEKAIEIIESRKRNPFYGAGVYTDESIVLMTEAVNDWISGKNKARKYITVQELTRLTEEGLPAMSKDNALNLLMLAQQRIYKDLMERKGYTPEVLLELEEFIGPQGQAMKEFLLKEYYREGEMLRPVYEDTYGIPFPNVKNYCPARFYVYDKVSDAELMQLLSKESAFATMRSDGFLSVRKQHDRNPDTTVGALGLFWQHCQMVDNWVYTSELVTDYKAVLSDVRMSQKMVVNIGKTDFYEFKAFLSNIQNAGVELASGFVQADKLMNSFAGNVSSLALVGRVTTILNQSTALLNGLHGCDLSIAEWVGAMARVASGKGAVTVSDLFRSDLFSWRRDGYAYGNLIGMKKQLGGSWNMLERSSDKLLGLMGEMDALMNAVSFAAVYDHYFRQQMDLRDVGGVPITRDMAHKYAVNQVEEGLARAAQPIDWSQKSKYMANAKGISVMQFMYKGEVMKKLGLVASRFRSGQKLLGIRSWLLCGFSMQLVAYLVQNLCRDDERDDKDLLSYLPGVVLGPINGVPLFGELLGVPINKALAALGSDYSVNVGGMGGFAFSYRDVERLFSEDKTTLDAVKNKSRGISASALILGALTKSGTIARGATMATAGVSNIIEFLSGLLDKLDVQDEAEDERERRAKEKKDWAKKNK